MSPPKDRGQKDASRREARLTARKLREAHGFLEAIVENIPNMIFVKDARELRFVRFNRAGEELLGWSRDELIGKNDYDFFPAAEADFFTSKDRAVLQTGEMLDIPEEVIDTAHGERWLHTRKVPVFDADGEPMYLLGISEDITAKREAAAELARLNEDLARSNDELQQFAYVASHDLQEPLRTITGYLELLEERYADKLDEEGRGFIDAAVRGARRQRALIRGLLDFSRARTRELHPAEVDLGRLFTDLCRDLETALERSEARVTWDEGLPALAGDPGLLTKLFQNLVSNAIKFRGERPPEVHVSATRAGDVWEIRVRDNGIGVAPAHFEQIFGIYTRLHKIGAYPGAGIGLAVCRRIAERHGGGVIVESSRQQGDAPGTTMLVTLPA